MAKTPNYIGSTFSIPQGTRINVGGEAKRQFRDAEVTVIKQTSARNGKQRIFWKSNGDRSANVLVD